MPQPELSRKQRKQLANFKSEMAHQGVHNRVQFDAFVKKMKPEEYTRIAGLIPHAFPSPQSAARAS
ncbi:MAG TPA: hypothetical protein VF974_00460 [Patescibacteria group bacterium]